MSKELEDLKLKLKDDAGAMRRLLLIEKQLKALEIIKKYAVFNGWSGDYTIRFWDMKENEIKLIDEVLS